MVSLLKGKQQKSYRRLTNGSTSSQDNLLTSSPSPGGGTNGNPMGKKKKKKKKRKQNKSPSVEPLTAATTNGHGNAGDQRTAAGGGGDDGEGDGGARAKKPKKIALALAKKKVKCDKLLLNMLKKKRKLLKKKLNGSVEMESSTSEQAMDLDSTRDEEDVCENGGVVPEEVKPPKKKKKLMGMKSKSMKSMKSVNTEEQVPLLQSNKKSEVKHHSGKMNGAVNGNVNGVSVVPTVPELPIAECRETFIKRFWENDTLIVVGETGCGKSTQIPQYLYKDCPTLFSYRGMAVTQPRRVAAITLANRVSYELGTELGGLVGFKVRFDKQVCDETKITFLTDGFLMMDAIRDKHFREYSVIIVDEAHERSVETDVVLSLLRNAQILRKSNPKKRLKLIIMSATLDVDKFKSFFDLEEHGLTTRAVFVKGRPYSLNLNYLPRDVPESHVDLTWITLLKLHLELPTDHHVLVFLTGKEEIDLICARASAINHQKDMAKVYVCPLYAALSKEAQMKSFELPAENTRKIVVSTNIAETSLTIPGIRVVIDSGRVKSKYFDETLGMDVLRVQLTSKSQANQRAGRAGRECEGSVFRLYMKSDYEKMEEFPLPEITRSNLSRILLLAAVSLEIRNFKEFPLPDPPSNKAIKYALNELHQYGAIVNNQEPVKLTRTAKRLLSFPVDLHLAKVLYLAVQYQELSRICAIVAISTVESVYNPDVSEGEIRHNKYQTLWAPEGDYITFWRIFKEFKKAKNKKSWCKEYGIQFRTMLYVVQVWRHLLTVCQEMKLEDDERLSCGDAIDFNDKAQLIFKTAFSHQVAKLSKTGLFYIVQNQFDPSIKFHAKIHPSSSLIVRKPGRLMFTHLSLNEVDNTVYMHNCGVL